MRPVKENLWIGYCLFIVFMCFLGKKCPLVLSSFNKYLMSTCYDQLLCYSKISNMVSIFTELHYYVNIHAHPNMKVYILCVDNLSNLCTEEEIQCELV